MTDGLEILQPIFMLHIIISRRYFDNESCGWLKGMNKEPAKQPKKAASAWGLKVGVRKTTININVNYVIGTHVNYI